MKKHDRYHDFWFTIMIIEVIISQLHSVTDYATRIGAYFYIGHIYEMALACKIGNIKQRALLKSFVQIRNPLQKTCTILAWIKEDLEQYIKLPNCQKKRG